MSRVIDGKSVILPRAFIGQSGFVQHSVDPRPGTKRKLSAKSADTSRSNGLLQCTRQLRPVPQVILIAPGFILTNCRWPGWRFVGLMQGTAGVMYSTCDFSRRRNICRPVENLAPTDSMLEFRFTSHSPSLIPVPGNICADIPGLPYRWRFEHSGRDRILFSSCKTFFPS